MSEISDILFSCPKFVVEKTKSADKEVFYVRPQDAAGVIALDEQGRILVTREFRPKTNQIHWRMPAGRCEAGEDLITTARRELREETGFDARELVHFFTAQSLTSWLLQEQGFFIARGLFSSPLETGDEEIKPEVHFLEPTAVLKLLNDGDIVGDIAAALYRFLHTQNLV